MRLSISQRMPHGLLRAASWIQRPSVTGEIKVQQQKGHPYYYMFVVEKVPEARQGDEGVLQARRRTLVKPMVSYTPQRKGG